MEVSGDYITHQVTLSTKGCSHQARANRSSQSGVQGERETFQGNSVPTGHASPGEKEGVLPGDNREAAYIEEAPTLVPDWSITMQMRNPNLHNLIGPNCIVSIGQNFVF